MPERGTKTSTVPVAWATFGIFSARSKWFPVGSDWWPWTKPGYITRDKATINGVAAQRLTPPQKIPSAKIRWKSSRLDFGGLRRHLLIDYLPKDQTINTECYSSLLVQLKDVLKKKCRRKVTKGSCSCTTMPQLTGHLQPRRNWPTWASSVLITLSILPLTTCSLDWKKKLKVRHFSSDTEVIAAAETRWDRKPSGFFNLLNFFWVACER